jgi:hypothetical protein
MTSLLHAREGGFAMDSSGELTLHVAPGALNVDTMVTILPEDDPPAAAVGYDVLRTWRVDAYPAPVELNARASLAHRLVEDVAGSVRLFLRSGRKAGAIPSDGWEGVDTVSVQSRWLDAKVRYLPPATTSAPQATYGYVCLVRVP